jgi:preprotein translocase subunit YajC
MPLSLLVIVGLLVIMWLLLIRPQRRRQQKQQDLIGGLEVGDEILTAGGVYAHVEELGEDDLRVEIAPGTSVRLDKRAVAAVMPREDEDEELEEAEPEPEEVDEPTSTEAARR